MLERVRDLASFRLKVNEIDIAIEGTHGCLWNIHDVNGLRSVLGNAVASKRIETLSAKRMWNMEWLEQARDTLGIPIEFENP